jgi:hypothetical protein
VYPGVVFISVLARSSQLVGTSASKRPGLGDNTLAAAAGVVPTAGSATAAAVTVAPARNRRRLSPALRSHVSLALIGPSRAGGRELVESLR